MARRAGARLARDAIPPGRQCVSNGGRDRPAGDRLRRQAAPDDRPAEERAAVATRRIGGRFNKGDLSSGEPEQAPGIAFIDGMAGLRQESETFDAPDLPAHTTPLGPFSTGWILRVSPKVLTLEYLATIRLSQEVAIWSTYQNLK